MFPERDDMMPDYKIASWATEQVARNDGHPAWLGMGFMTPHVPQYAPKKWVDLYGADGQTALPAYLYLLQSRSFLHKWLIGWCDVYEPDTGRISHCAPTFHRAHSPAWGGIVAPLAWSLYLHFGDRHALDKAHPVILGYCRFTQAAVRDAVLRQAAMGSDIDLEVEVPRDTTATVHVPGRKEARAAGPGKHTFIGSM